MNKFKTKKFKILSSVLVSFVIMVLIAGSAVYSFSQKQKEVKGVNAKAHAETKKSPTPTPTTVVSESNIESEDEMSESISSEPKKQFGGWYLNPDTDEIERWMGYDSDGNDLWEDSYSSENEDNSDDEDEDEDADESDSDSTDEDESYEESDESSEDEESDENETSHNNSNDTGGPVITIGGNGVNSNSAVNPPAGGDVTVIISQ